MAIRCEKCKHIIEGKGLHAISECPKCHQKDPAMFTRVEDEDIDPSKSESDKKWLEDRRL